MVGYAFYEEEIGLGLVGVFVRNSMPRFWHYISPF